MNSNPGILTHGVRFADYAAMDIYCGALTEPS